MILAQTIPWARVIEFERCWNPEGGWTQAMNKPYNPYPKNSVKWTIMQGSIDVPGGGWADLTQKQIAEVLDMPVLKVRNAILKIETETGYKIPRLDGRKARYGHDI